MGVRFKGFVTLANCCSIIVKDFADASQYLEWRSTHAHIVPLKISSLFPSLVWGEIGATTPTGEEEDEIVTMLSRLVSEPRKWRVSPVLGLKKGEGGDEDGRLIGAGGQ